LNFPKIIFNVCQENKNVLCRYSLKKSVNIINCLADFYELSLQSDRSQLNIIDRDGEKIAFGRRISLMKKNHIYFSFICFMRNKILLYEICFLTKNNISLA